MKDHAVYLVDAVRSPQAKAGTELKDVPAPYLTSHLVRHLIDNTTIPDDQVDEVVIGNVGAPAKYPNIGRVIALEAGLAESTSAYTVHRNCASGLEAISQALLKIAAKRSDVIVAGGVESMSQMPLIYGPAMTELFVRIMKAKSAPAKLRLLSKFRPQFLAPVVAIEEGLRDPFCGLNMGQTAEVLARELGITRQEQDEFANASHHKAVAAQKAGRFDEEIVALAVGSKRDRLLSRDTGLRANSTIEGLGKMRPYFDRKSGTVTVGNSCPITDGGSAALLVSEQALQRYRLTPMARIVEVVFAGLAPKYMGMGPLLAMAALLERTGKTIEEMDLIEINEAFAAQTLAVLAACKDGKLAARFGVEQVLGDIPAEKFNVNGGAIALGHPVGSTGSRLVATLAHELRRRQGKWGLASLCIGGGQGGAVLLENLS